MDLTLRRILFVPAFALTLLVNAQSDFRVTNSLPNVTRPLARNWAGNIPVQREAHPNDTLFFWAFESSHGSLTAKSDKPWGIWFSGGPGTSSLIGLFFENNPIQISNNCPLHENEYAWNNVADYVWIDQPVGTGFSTADSNSYVHDEDQMAADSMGFLENFIKVFPNLAKRPLYLTAIAGWEVSKLLPVVSVLEIYPQIIGYDTDVFETSLCGHNLTLHYPQPEPFPTLTYVSGKNPASSDPDSRMYRTKVTTQEFMLEAQNRFAAKLSKRDATFSKHERIRAREAWKRSLADRANGTIDPWYGCDIYGEMLDYAINYTFPWSLSQSSGGMFDIYDIPEALDPEAPMNASVCLDNPQTRAAIHALTSKNWADSIDCPFANDGNSIPPTAFVSDLATNATAHDMKVIIYSGNDDSLLAHLGSEVVTIQNTTFGGVRGFARKPETPWYNDNGEFAGIVHQERGWTFALAVRARHLLGYNNPVSALTLARDLIFGNNQTGLVTKSSAGSVVVIAGEVSSLGSGTIRGEAGIYYGSATTESTRHFFPSATVEAWNKYTVTAIDTPWATMVSSACVTNVISSKAFVLGLVLVIASIVVA